MTENATSGLLLALRTRNVPDGTMQKYQDPKEKNLCMQRKLGLASSISMTISSVIGIGIFISPKGTLKYTGSVGMSLVVWGLSGLISMIGAICFTELGTSIPFSGCKYTYLLMCFGELPAFLYLWTSIVIFAPVYNVIVSLTFANYILQLFIPNCASSTGAVRLLALLPICLLTYVNCRNVHWATRVQGIFTTAKLLAVTIIIIAGLYHLYSGNTQNFDNAFRDTTKNPGNVALGFFYGLYAYAGWDFINHVTEELKNPTVNLPRNIYISLSIVTVIYILVNVAYLAVLSPIEILTSNAVAVTFGEKIFGTMFSSVISLIVVLSALGTMNSRIYRYSRIFFTAAKEGHLPSLLGMVHVKYLTPVPSIIFMFLLTLMYLSTTEILFLLNYGRFVSGLFSLLTITGFLWLRYKEPNLERPIKVNLCFPVTYFLVSAFLVIFPFFADLRQPLMGIVVVSTGIPIYMTTVTRRNKPHFYDKALKNLKLSSLIQESKIILRESSEHTSKEPQPLSS